MRRRRFLAVLGVGLAGCTQPDPAMPTRSPAEPPTNSPTSAPTPSPEDDRPTATPRNPKPLSVSGSWPQFGSDAGHSGVTSNAGVPEAGEAYWHLRRIRSGPVVLADGRLFHYAKLGTETSGEPTITRTREQPAGTAHDVDGEPYLLARDASDGRIDWAVPAPGSVAGWPAVVDGRVIADFRGGLAAFDARDGTVLWKHDLGDRNVGDPTIAGDAVVVPIGGVVDGQTGEVLEEPAVRVHDLTSGSLQWTVRPPKRGNDVAVAGDTVVVVSYGWDGTGVVLALSLTNGSERWRVEIPGDYFDGPVVVDGTIFLSTSERDLRALSLADGSEQWQREFESRPPAPAADGGTVYVGDRRTLFALGADDGAVRWRTTPDGDDWGSFVTPAVGKQTVYAGTAGGYRNLFAFDASDGTERWSHSLPETVVEGDIVTSGLEAQPTVAEGAVYAYAADGLYAFGPGD